MEKTFFDIPPEIVKNNIFYWISAKEVNVFLKDKVFVLRMMDVYPNIQHYYLTGIFETPLSSICVRDMLFSIPKLDIKQKLLTYARYPILDEWEKEEVQSIRLLKSKKDPLKEKFIKDLFDLAFEFRNVPLCLYLCSKYIGTLRAFFDRFTNSKCMFDKAKTFRRGSASFLNCLLQDRNMVLDENIRWICRKNFLTYGSLEDIRSLLKVKCMMPLSITHIHFMFSGCPKGSPDILRFLLPLCSDIKPLSQNIFEEIFSYSEVLDVVLKYPKLYKEEYISPTLLNKVLIHEGDSSRIVFFKNIPEHIVFSVDDCKPYLLKVADPVRLRRSHRNHLIFSKKSLESIKVHCDYSSEFCDFILQRLPEKALEIFLGIYPTYLSKYLEIQADMAHCKPKNSK